MDEEMNQLDKLGTVLAVANQINRDMLDVVKHQQEMMDSQHQALKENYEDMRVLLDGQQKRQADIIHVALAAVVAIVICSCLTFYGLARRIDSGVEVLRNDYQTSASARLSK